MFEIIDFYVHLFKVIFLFPINKLLYHSNVARLPVLLSDYQAAELQLPQRLQIPTIEPGTALPAVTFTETEYRDATMSGSLEPTTPWLISLFFVLLLVSLGALALQSRSESLENEGILDVTFEVSNTAVTPASDIVKKSPISTSSMINDIDSSSSFSSSSFVDVACITSSYYVYQKHTKLFLDDVHSASEYLDAVYGSKESILGYDDFSAQLLDSLFLESLPKEEDYLRFSVYDKRLAMRNFRAVTLLDYKGQNEELKFKWEAWKKNLEAILEVILLDSQADEDSHFLDAVALTDSFFVYASDSINYDLFSICLNILLQNIERRPSLKRYIIRSCCSMVSAVCPRGFVRIVQNVKLSSKISVFIQCVRYYILVNYIRLLGDFWEVISLLHVFKGIVKEIEVPLKRHSKDEAREERGIDTMFKKLENSIQASGTSSVNYPASTRASSYDQVFLATASDAADTYLICNKFFLGNYYENLTKDQRQTIYQLLQDVHATILVILDTFPHPRPMLVEPGLQPDCI